jgi:hypothetical protein
MSQIGRGVMQGFDQNEDIEGNSICLVLQTKVREVGPGYRMAICPCPSGLLSLDTWSISQRPEGVCRLSFGVIGESQPFHAQPCEGN